MRNLLEKYYKDIFVVSIAAPKDGMAAFSADTGMNEVLVIATRRVDNSAEKFPVTYFNLYHCPRSILEAIEVAKVIVSSKVDGKGCALRLGTQQTIGHCIQSKTGFSNLIGPPGAICTRDVEITKVAIRLAQGRLHIPRFGDVSAPIVRLEELGVPGPVHRGILERFDKVALDPDGIPTYPMLWKHDARSGRESRMIVEPDCQGQVRSGKCDEALEFWNEHSTHLCFNSNFRLNSQPLSACMTRNPVLGGNAWPGFRCHDHRHEIPVVLWMNTTIGLISHWCAGTRQQNARALVTVSLLPTIGIFDMRDLTDAQLETARVIFNDFSKKMLRPASEACSDGIRQDLDRAVLIDLLAQPEDIMEPLQLLRNKWCLEPTVHGGKSVV